MQDFIKYIKKIKLDKNNILIGIAVVAIIVTGVIIYVGPNFNFFTKEGFNIFGQSDKQIAQKAIDFINNNGLSQEPASLSGDITEQSGLIKFKIKISNNEFDSYVSKDGKLLFPQAINIEDKKTGDNNNTGITEEQKQQAAESVKKTDNPILEAYVVAMCPYGTQMQRAMADAVNSVPELAKYIKARYIGSVSPDGKTIEAMHGADEAAENLRQICVRDEQPAKYWNYISCYIKAGNASSCEKTAGVDSSALNACVSSPTRGVVYAKKDFDLNIKYNVQGSPTLMIGENLVDESMFGGRSSDGVKNIVCAAFNSKPAFCSQTLNTAEAAVSFSEEYAGSASSNSANCE